MFYRLYERCDVQSAVADHQSTLTKVSWLLIITNIGNDYRRSFITKWNMRSVSLETAHLTS